MFEKRDNIRVRKILAGFGLSQSSLFLIMLDSFIGLVLSDTLFFVVFFFIILVFISASLHSFKYLIAGTFRRFVVFIVVVLLFSFFKDFNLFALLLVFFKILDLLILGVCFHCFVDFVYLLNYFDFILNKIGWEWLRKGVRKFMCSLLLGIRFVPEFISFGRELKRTKSLRGYKNKNGFIADLRDSVKMLIPMFMLSFKKALEIERAYIVKGFNFSRIRSFYNREEIGKKDIVFLAASLVLTVSVIVFGW